MGFFHRLVLVLVFVQSRFRFLFCLRLLGLFLPWFESTAFFVVVVGIIVVVVVTEIGLTVGRLLGYDLLSLFAQRRQCLRLGVFLSGGIAIARGRSARRSGKSLGNLGILRNVLITGLLGLLGGRRWICLSLLVVQRLLFLPLFALGFAQSLSHIVLVLALFESLRENGLAIDLRQGFEVLAVFFVLDQLALVQGFHVHIEFFLAALVVVRFVHVVGIGRRRLGSHTSARFRFGLGFELFLLLLVVIRIDVHVVFPVVVVFLRRRSCFLGLGFLRCHRFLLFLLFVFGFLVVRSCGRHHLIVGLVVVVIVLVVLVIIVIVLVLHRRAKALASSHEYLSTSPLHRLDGLNHHLLFLFSLLLGRHVVFDPRGEAGRKEGTNNELHRVPDQQGQGVQGNVGVPLVDSIDEGNSHGHRFVSARVQSHDPQLVFLEKEHAERVPGQDHEEYEQQKDEEDHQENVPDRNVLVFCDKSLAKDRIDNVDERIHLELFEVRLVFLDKVVDNRDSPLEALSDGDRQEDANGELGKDLHKLDVSLGTNVSHDEDRTHEDTKQVSKGAVDNGGTLVSSRRHGQDDAHVDGEGQTGRDDHSVGQTLDDDVVVQQEPAESKDNGRVYTKIEDLHKGIEIAPLEGLGELFGLESETGQQEDEHNSDPCRGDLGYQVNGSEGRIGLGNQNGKEDEGEKLVFPVKGGQFFEKRLFLGFFFALRSSSSGIPPGGLGFGLGSGIFFRRRALGVGRCSRVFLPRGCGLNVDILWCDIFIGRGWGGR
mmetsp:Transcript_26693/g.73406  ORF Transcript_26693/g.73406 Transcript_26693/m.73406 type:complete len:766 (+) Transcript_26693:2211-4508(+)